MALKTEEQEYWKERIESRIARAIKSFYSMEDPNLLRRIREQARRIAVKKLGLGKLMEEREQIEEDYIRLTSSRKRIFRELVAAFRKCEPHEVMLPYDCDGFDIPSDLSSAIRDAALPVVEELLSKKPLGKKILNLRREKDELLDALWLVDSSTTVKVRLSRTLCEAHQVPPKEVADSHPSSQLNGVS